MSENKVVAILPLEVQSRIHSLTGESVSPVAKLTPEQAAVLAKLDSLVPAAETFHFIPPAKREEKARLKRAFYNNALPQLICPEKARMQWEPNSFLEATEQVLFFFAGRDAILKDCIDGILLTPKRVLLFRDFNSTKAQYLYTHGAELFHAPIRNMKEIVVSKETEKHPNGHITFAIRYKDPLSKESAPNEDQVFRCSVVIDNSLAKANLMQMLKTVNAFAPAIGLKVVLK